MKTLKTVMKVLAFFAAIAAAVYVGMTYGDKILAWIKKILRIDVIGNECCEEVCCCEEDCCEEPDCCQAPAATPATEHVEAEDQDFES